MEPWIQMALTVVVTVLACNGFWAYLQSRRDKKDAKTRMILGLGHDRIVAKAMEYIERGWVSKDEYEDLNKYLYEPYTAMGGNGTVRRLMVEVQKLPIRDLSYTQQARHIQEAGVNNG